MCVVSSDQPCTYVDSFFTVNKRDGKLEKGCAYFHGAHLFKSDVDSRHHSAEPYHCSVITDLYLYLQYNMNVPAFARKESVNIEICNLQKFNHILCNFLWRKGQRCCTCSRDQSHCSLGREQMQCTQLSKSHATQHLLYYFMSLATYLPTYVCTLAEMQQERLSHACAHLRNEIYIHF